MISWMFLVKKTDLKAFNINLNTHTLYNYVFCYMFVK